VAKYYCTESLFYSNSLTNQAFASSGSAKYFAGKEASKAVLFVEKYFLCFHHGNDSIFI
jgi:hypothetical protein